MQELLLIIDPALQNWIVGALHAAILTNAHLLTPMLSPPRSVLSCELKRCYSFCRWEAGWPGLLLIAYYPLVRAFLLLGPS